MPGDERGPFGPWTQRPSGSTIANLGRGARGAESEMREKRKTGSAMTSFDAADMNLGDDYGHPETVVDRPRSIGKRHPQIMSSRAADRRRSPPAEKWSESDGVASLDRTAGKPPT